MLEETIHSFLEEAARRIVENAVDGKLRDAGLGDMKGLRDALIAHARSDAPGPFRYQDDGPKRSVDLTFDKDDLLAMEARMECILDGLPEIIGEAAEAGAAPMHEDLWRRWPKEKRQQEQDRRRFVHNLEGRWGAMLDGLRMLLTVCREHGFAVTEARDTNADALSHVTAHLYVRALQVTSECVTLLEQGYADGASARWRTLHEASVILVLMNEHGLPLAERYLAHQAIDAWQEHNTRLHAPPYPFGLANTSPDDGDAAALRAAYDQAILTYGPTFKHSYGWAKGYVPRTDSSGNVPGFSDLAAAAGRAVLAEDYKFASYNVHPTARSFGLRLGLMGSEGLLTGASNAGLELPAANVAESLTLATAFFSHPTLVFNDIMVMKMAQRLRDDTIEAGIAARDQLQLDHESMNTDESFDDG